MVSEVCQAKDPDTCRNHGTKHILDSAMRENDVQKYFEARDAANSKGVKKSFASLFKNSFLPKKSNTLPALPAPLEHFTCYSSYGFATHLRKSEEDNTALCGRAIVKTGHAVTAGEVVRLADNQHSSFFYCEKCAEAFTGISGEVFLSQRRRD